MHSCSQVLSVPKCWVVPVNEARNVHVQVVGGCRGKLFREKLTQMLRFCSCLRKFSQRNLYFPPIHKSFLPQKFPAIHKLLLTASPYFMYAFVHTHTYTHTHTHFIQSLKMVKKPKPKFKLLLQLQMLSWVRRNILLPHPLSCPLLMSHHVWRWRVSLPPGAMRQRRWFSTISAWRSIRSVGGPR